MKKILILCFFVLLWGCSSPSDNREAPQDDSPQVEQGASDAPKIGLDVGMIPPDFDIMLLNGENGGKLSDLMDKPILLNLWTTWCPPCVLEMPHFQKVYDEYGGKINILAISIGEAEDTVAAFVNENSLTFPIALDQDGIIYKLYNVQSFPQTFIIGKDGVITDYIPHGMDEQLVFELVERAITD